MTAVLAAAPGHARSDDNADPAQLAARVAELEAEKAQLMGMLTRLQRVSQTGLITSALAHDANNYVQAISGASYLALQKDSPQRWRDALEKIQQQCVAMAETTTCFLGFVRRRETAGGMQFALSRVVADTCRLLKPLALRRSVSLDHAIGEDALVNGDPRHATQAMVNLVTNAIRACASGDGRVTITAGATAEGMCRIEVADNGPGIPEEIRSRIFRPFATGHAEDGGNGLGLFIARRLVRELAGRITLTSSPRGATVSIDLPTSSVA